MERRGVMEYMCLGVVLFIYYLFISDIYSPFFKSTEDDLYVTHRGSDLGEPKDLKDTTPK